MKRLAALLFCTAVLKSASAQLPQEIFNIQWMHSKEEDHDSVKVYRPSSFQFPPARGRDSFTIKADGEIAVYPIGPADARNSANGRWKFVRGTSARVTFADSPRRNFTLTIVSLTKNLLNVTLRAEARENISK